MKKIFTLIAVAVMALGAQAQEKVLFASDGAYGNGATLTSENTTLVLGNDRTTKNYDLKLTSAKAYCAGLFGQQVMVENEDGVQEEKTRVVYLVGNQNPKDGELDGDKSAGSGYKPESANLPQSGTYYMITPNKNGHICAYIILNGSKNFYIVKASDGSCLSLNEFVIQADGDEPVPVNVNEDFTVDEKTTGTVDFDVVAGETYYVFCTGSKLSFGGYVFTPSGDGPQPGPNGLVIDPALPVTFNSWDANFLIMKTDVKAGDKFVFTCEAVDVEGWEWGPQVLPKSNADWSDLGPALVPNAQGKATFEITEDYAAVINGNGGLRVQGMGVKVTDVEYVEGSAPGPEGDHVSIIDKFNGTWNPSETQTHNEDGSITFNAVSWGGLSAWLAENDTPVDWSAYSKIVFEFAEPTTVTTQILVMTASDNNVSASGNAGITKLECSFEGKDVTQVNQVALQCAEPTTLVIKAIYLVKAGSVEPQPEEGWLELVHNGNVEGDDGVSLVTKNGADGGVFTFNPQAGVGVDGSRAAVVVSSVGAANDWDSQFFIYAPDYVFKLGDKYKVSFMAKASEPVELPGPQAHTTPGNYIGWYIDGSSAVNLTTEWQEVSFQGTVTDAQEANGGLMAGMSTLAYNLNIDKANSFTFYFDNISWKVAVDADGIQDMKIATPVQNGAIYNLAGVRVNKDYKGIVIQNGRKFVQK